MVNLILLTCLNVKDARSKLLRKSCKKYKINLTICGLDMEYKRKNNMKIKWIKSFFKNNKLTNSQKDNTILLFVDGFDLCVNSHFSELKIIKKFLTYNCDILHSYQKRQNKSGDFEEITDLNNNNLRKYNMNINNNNYNNFFGLNNNFVLNTTIFCGYYKKMKNYIKFLDKTYNNLKEDNNSKFYHLEKNNNNVCGDQLLITYLYNNNLLNNFNIKCDINNKIYTPYARDGFLSICNKWLPEYKLSKEDFIKYWEKQGIDNYSISKKLKKYSFYHSHLAKLK